jgi:hypothetical protein
MDRETEPSQSNRYTLRREKITEMYERLGGDVLKILREMKERETNEPELRLDRLQRIDILTKSIKNDIDEVKNLLSDL